MSDTTPTENPKVELANKDWVLKELMSTEQRIERAFHEQTKFLSTKNDDLKKEFADTINTQTRWMVGLTMTMTVAIIAAVLFKG